jgi:ribose 1,5-bisphosphate isomerase
VETLIDRIRRDMIGGAADTAREAAAALAAAARDSQAGDTEDLAREIETAIDRILEVTPSVAPVTRVLDLIGRHLDDTSAVSLANSRERVVAEASLFTSWLDDALQRIASIGANLIGDGEVLFTYSISSTVFKMVEAARQQGKRVALVTTESRPGNEGLTTIPRMTRAGVPVTIGIDAAVGQLLRGCTSVIVGADTVTAGGSALCKVGSLPTALVAREYGIPFRLAADTSKFDPRTLGAGRLLIREMPAADILEEIPPLVTVCNPVFESIPAHLINEIVTEQGIVHPGGVAVLMRDLPQSRTVSEILQRRSRGDGPQAARVAGSTDA